MSLPSNSGEPIKWGFGNFPPYLYMSKKGKPDGPYADIVEKIFKHAGIEYQVLIAPNRRSRKSINDGNIEFSIGPLTTLDKPDNFYISDSVVAKIDLRAFWIGNQKSITQASDLNGESVILIASYGYSGLRRYIENPDNKVNLAVNVEDHKRALLALTFKRGKYMLAYRAPVDLIQLEMNIQDLHSFPLIQTDIHLIINKSVKNSRQIMDSLERSYSILYSKTSGAVIAH